MYDACRPYCTLSEMPNLCLLTVLDVKKALYERLDEIFLTISPSFCNTIKIGGAH